MKKQMSLEKIKKSSEQSGIATVDFIFSMVMMVGMGILLFSLSYSLVAIEVSQYVAFATARSHSAAHLTIAENRSMAERKFKSLTAGADANLASFFNNGWFELKMNPTDLRSGGSTGTDFASEYGLTDADKLAMHGVRLQLSAKIMNKKLPLIGSTSDEDDAYQANITAFLTREASQQECQQWFVDRKNALRNLFQRVQGQDMSAYFEVEDNGC